MTETTNDIDFEGEESLETTQLENADEYPIISVKSQQRQYSIREICEYIDEKVIILDPDFQRDRQWSREQDSDLIESILMGLPLPLFYFFSDKRGISQVVDGRQRLSAIHDFLNEKFSLIKTKILKQYEGKNIKSLPPEIASKFMRTQLLINEIQYPTPERIKYDLFDRVNRGGTKLNNQQMRNALYLGKSTRLINKLSENQTFQKVVGINNSNRHKWHSVMKDRYIIIRFLAFYLLIDGKLAGYKLGDDIDEFLAFVMGEKINKMDDNEINELELKFILAMERAYSVDKDLIFRFNTQWRSPVNLILFEMIGYFLLKISVDIIEDKPKIKAYISNLKESLNNETLKRSNKSAVIKERIKIVREKLQDIEFMKLGNEI